MALIQLTVATINGVALTTPTAYGFDTDDICEIITNDGTYSKVISRAVKGIDWQKRSQTKVVYEVTETLAAIRNMTDDLFLCDLLYKNFTAVSYQGVFVANKVSGGFYNPGSGTTFYYAEDGAPDLTKYVVSQTVAQIVAQTAPGGSFWALGGNTLGAVTKLGSLDNFDVSFIVNGSQQMRLSTVGLGIGVAASYKLDVNSGANELTGIARFANTKANFVVFTSDASPETIITATTGDICIVDDGVTGQMYIKKTGVATNTGWALMDSSANDWSLSGNTLSGGEIFGSINNQPVDFYSDNTFRGRLSASGLWGFNTNAPGALVDIVSLTSLPANLAFRIQAQTGLLLNALVVTDEGEVCINSLPVNNPVVGTPNNIFQSNHGGNYFQHNTNFLTFSDNVTTAFIGAITGTRLYMGTHSAHDYILRTTNFDRMLIQSTGEFTIGGSTTYSSQLTVKNINPLNDVLRAYSSTSAKLLTLLENGPLVLGATAWDTISSIQSDFAGPITNLDKSGFKFNDAISGNWQFYSQTIEGLKLTHGGFGQVLEINASGYFGIGEFTPTAKLHLKGDIGDSIVKADDDSSNTIFEVVNSGYTYVYNGLYGGQTASDDLFLNSTTNATKGRIVIGGQMVWDETNYTLGLGSGVSSLYTLNVTGSLGMKQVAKSANYTFDAGGTKDFMVFADTNGINITIPDAVSNPDRIIVIKNRVAAASTINIVSGGGSIEGAAGDTITNSLAGVYNSKAYQSDGTNWWRIW